MIGARDPSTEAALEVQTGALRGVLGRLGGKLPRVFVGETEYQLHMIDAPSGGAPTQTWKPGEGGLPTDGVAFGATVR
ncbi:hypothetical protein [Streptomyces sp. NBC_01618]|uniref:hypothetical protein n=1 Tax=Streptomyces sp. NBC_01618 TaxID=2975900 RepID=UPI00386A759B|nr:hypothetical protein OH735_06620 [Streptomyces sp. NBC_01618]